MADEIITQGVSGRIETTVNTGNYNAVKVSVEGSKEEIAEQMPGFISLVVELSKGVRAALGKPTEAIVPPETGTRAPVPAAAPPAAAPVTNGHTPAVEGEAAVITPYPNNKPLPEPPEETGELYEGRAICKCPWCKKHNAVYVGKKGKSAGKTCFSCGKDYGGCGAWYVWSDEVAR